MHQEPQEKATASAGSPPPFYELGALASRAECSEWIGRIDAAMGSRGVPGISELHGDLSKRMRAAIDADAGATEWLRAAADPGMREVGGNERFEVVVSDRWFLMRYDDGDEGMSAHMDGTVRLAGDGAGGCRSAATLLLYLDDGFAGGRTLFLADAEPRWSYDPDPEPMGTQDAVAVAPRPGRAVLIRQDAWHAAERVWGGRKHLLRTDVGYSPSAFDHCVVHIS